MPCSSHRRSRDAVLESGLRGYLFSVGFLQEDGIAVNSIKAYSPDIFGKRIWIPVNTDIHSIVPAASM